MVDKKIYLKTWGQPLVPGLKLLGYLDASVPNVPAIAAATTVASATVPLRASSSAAASWDAALLAGTLAEVKTILEQMKLAPLGAAPGLLDRALEKIARH